MNLEEILKQSKLVSRGLVLKSDEEISSELLALADAMVERSVEILEANKKDLSKMSEDDPMFDRLLLSKERIADIADSVREIAGYSSPIGDVLEQRVLKNDLQLSKVTTPIGVVGAIFEARPNVVIDIFALCYKSKNACVLKGGSDAEHSNEALVKIIKNVISDGDACALLGNDRNLVKDFLQADNYVDVIVPRGSSSLIQFVRENSKIPVIETGAGVVHTFVDKSADMTMAREVIFNAKTSRPSVCNALDCLIVHEAVVFELPEMVSRLAEFEVEIFADEKAYAALDGSYEFLKKSTPESFGTEFLGLKMSIKTVAGLDEAIDHISTFGSGHSEAILTEDEGCATKFLNAVDAAAVYVNASTRFTDGGVFGLGAEVGISTQKLHARGPMGIKDLTSYKWQIVGNGQVR